MRVDESDLSAYLDNEIDDAATCAAIEKRIEEDPEFARAATRLRAVRGLMRDQMEESNLHDVVVARAKRSERWSFAGKSRSYWFGWAMAIAAACFIVIAAVDYWSSSGTLTGPSEVAETPRARTFSIQAGMHSLGMSMESATISSGSSLIRRLICLNTEAGASAVIARQDTGGFGVYMPGDTVAGDIIVTEIHENSVSVMSGERPVIIDMNRDARWLADCAITIGAGQKVACAGWVAGDRFYLVDAFHTPIAYGSVEGGTVRLTLATNRGEIAFEGEAPRTSDVAAGSPFNLRAGDGSRITLELG